MITRCEQQDNSTTACLLSPGLVPERGREEGEKTGGRDELSSERGGMRRGRDKL